MEVSERNDISERTKGMNIYHSVTFFYRWRFNPFWWLGSEQS